MPYRRRCRPIVRTVARVESVEPRTLLSTTMHPGAIYVRPAATVTPAALTTTVTGYTPAQIKAAYGFADLTFGTRAVAADGAGQTIAVVDAYNDPNIGADLKVFDAQFGLPAPPTFKVVNQGGGAGLPKTDSGWAGEIALDVEWAHAIAPGASILLVEAASDSTDDLVAAVNYARSSPGVSVVSMSWGGSEFVSSYQGGESTQQTTYDATFTTPVGHQGVTFVSAAGDSGQQAGVQWPASSTNVLSVGGTTLTLNADNSIASEVGWAGTSSGYSQVEAEPTYQSKAQSTGLRSVADVAYSADPDHGFAVYDSLPDAGVSGWQEVGGTSAGAPQWAALVAIANEGRVVAGASVLPSTGQTLTNLYALYAAAGTAAYTSTYTAAFNDVTTGGSGGYHFRRGGGGAAVNSASAGYDLVTGLGTPKAAAVIAALATAKAGTATGATPTTTDTTQSPIAITLLSGPPASVVGGAPGVLRARLSNATTATFTGPVTVVLYASADTAVSTDTDTVVLPLTIPTLRLRGLSSKVIALRFTYPDTLATGSYQLLAAASATGTTTTPTTAATAAVTITAPRVDLSVSFAGTDVAVVPGKRGRAVLRLTNLGNVSAVGPVAVNLYASASGAVDAGAVLLTPVVKRVRLAAGRSMTVTVPFTFPSDLVAGNVQLVAAISPTTTPTDDGPADNTAAVPTTA